MHTGPHMCVNYAHMCVNGNTVYGEFRSGDLVAILEIGLFTSRHKKQYSVFIIILVLSQKLSKYFI